MLSVVVQYYKYSVLCKYENYLNMLNFVVYNLSVLKSDEDNFINCLFESDKVIVNRMDCLLVFCIDHLLLEKTKHEKTCPQRASVVTKQFVLGNSCYV